MKMIPSRIRLEATTVCQLRCPLCPTAAGTIGTQLGAGFLRYEDFQRMIDQNPTVTEIELSNWGELFLNPDLQRIMRYAAQRHVTLRADNGVNLNTVSEELLEALVRYRFHSLTCSIDGASQETYALYRKQGHFERVIDHIRRINAYKARYRSPFPRLTWQFVVFGHNEHEIPRARRMAQDLRMSFWVKLSWSDTFSPVRNPQAVREATKWGAASRGELHARHGRRYLSTSFCAQLWRSPQINWDGRVLGCCVNYWGDFGNAFRDGLIDSLNNEKIRYARQMLLGKKPSRTDIPCTRCSYYQDMQQRRAWLQPREVMLWHVQRIGWLVVQIIRRLVMASWHRQKH